jgi:hypothetical protein
MFVRATDEKHILPFHPQVPGIDIRRNINPGEVTDMDRAIGIGQG